MSIKGIKGKQLAEIMELAATNNCKVLSTHQSKHFKIRAMRPDGSIGTMTMAVSPSDHRVKHQVKQQWRMFAENRKFGPQKD